MNKIAHISVRDICKIDFAQTIELNRVSIFFHEIFRINVELPHDLKFCIRILSKAFEKIWRPNSKICRAFFRIWLPNFFKGLTQNSNTKLKVMRQFYVDSENFMKK